MPYFLTQVTDSLFYKVHFFLKKFKWSYLDLASFLNALIQWFPKDKNDSDDQGDPQSRLDQWYVRFHLSVLLHHQVDFDEPTDSMTGPGNPKLPN